MPFAPPLLAAVASVRRCCCDIRGAAHAVTSTGKGDHARKQPAVPPRAAPLYRRLPIRLHTTNPPLRPPRPARPENDSGPAPPPRRLPAEAQRAVPGGPPRLGRRAAAFSPAPDREARAESRAMKKATTPARPRATRRGRSAPVADAAAPAAAAAARADGAGRAGVHSVARGARPPSPRPSRRSPSRAPADDAAAAAQAAAAAADGEALVGPGARPRVNVAPPPPPPPDETPEFHLDKALRSSKRPRPRCGAAARGPETAERPRQRRRGRVGGGRRLERDSGPRRPGGPAGGRGAAEAKNAAPPPSPPPGPDPRVVSAMSTRYADARRAAARARDRLPRPPAGRVPATRRGASSPTRRRRRPRPAGRAASTAPDAPPRTYGVDAEVDATPSYMQPTHRSGYRYKIDKTDGNWYRSDGPRMRPLDPRERVAVAAAGGASPRPVGRARTTTRSSSTAPSRVRGAADSARGGDARTRARTSSAATRPRGPRSRGPRDPGVARRGAELSSTSEC